MNILWFLFGVLLATPPVLFVLYCFDLMDSNKNENGFNRYNSYAIVQCDAKEKCDFRFSSICDSCKHNCGKQKFKNCYEPR